MFSEIQFREKYPQPVPKKNSSVLAKKTLNLQKLKINMAEDLTVVSGNKIEKYESILPQIKNLLDSESDLIANMGNLCAALKEQFNWLWIGFYIVKNDELVLGPFQGPVACTRIKKGRGVCGTSWAEAITLIVPDVDLFHGHIACSSLSKSEIVVPLFQNGEVWAILDVDDVDLNSFDETDKIYLEKIVQLIHLS